MFEINHKNIDNNYDYLQVKKFCEDIGIVFPDDFSFFVNEFIPAQIEKLQIIPDITPDQQRQIKEYLFNYRNRAHKGEDVTSAESITLTTGNSFTITGNMDIKYISTKHWDIGSVVILEFANEISLVHDHGTLFNTPNQNTPEGYAAIFLKNQSNSTFTINSTITLWYNGTHWKETSRVIVQTPAI